MDKTDILRKKKTGFTELEDKYWRALLLIQSHVNEPDVVKSIVDKAIGRPEDVIPLEEPEAEQQDTNPNFPLPSAMNNPEVNSLLGEFEKESPEDKHFGEEQAEGLDSLLEGLRDTPHDDRW